MSSTLKILLILIIISQSKVVAEENEEEKLGFLLKDRTIMVSKSIEILKVGLLVPGSKEYSHYKTVMEELIATIEKVNTLKLLEEESKYETQIHIITTQLDVAIGDINYILKKLHEYTDKEKRNISLHSCIFEYPAISVDKLQSKVEEVQMVMEYMNYSLTLAEVQEKPVLFRDVIDNLYNVKEIIEDIKRELEQRQQILDSLSSHKLHYAVSTWLQDLACYDSGNLEKLEILECSKTFEGMYCALKNTAYKATQKYVLYSEINYEGVQIKSPKVGQVFTKSLDKAWGYLDCKVNVQGKDIDHINQFSECTYTLAESPCLKKVETQEFKDIVKSCSFEFTEPAGIEQIDKGYLVTSDTIVVREVFQGSSTVSFVFPKKVPMYIETEKLLSVQLGDKEIVYKPDPNVEKRKVLYSWLTEEQIDELIEITSLQSFIDNIDEDDIADYVLGGIIAIILPITLCFCVRTIKTTDCYIRYQNRKKGRNVRKRRITESNLEANKIMLRELESKV